jgi:hypothetical protein
MSVATPDPYADPLGDAPHGQRSLLHDRLLFNDVIQSTVRDRRTVDDALAEVGLTEDTAPGVRARLEDELRKLAVHNCARYRLALRATEAWVDAGRPA